MSEAAPVSKTFTKRISLLIRKPGMSREEFAAHWRDHEPLALAVPGLRRFVLNHIQDQPTRGDVTTLELADIDGIAESWWDDRAANEHAYTTPEGKRWLAHGASFIGAMKTFVVTETVVID